MCYTQGLVAVRLSLLLTKTKCHVEHCQEGQELTTELEVWVLKGVCLDKDLLS